MKKFWFQIFGLMIVILVVAFLVFNQEYLTPLSNSLKRSPRPNQVASQQNDILKIVAADGTEKAELNIEIAKTKEVRAKGLGYRESLATNSGMLFIHEVPEKFTYWMKGMEFPIDIMWISGDTIADIIPNIPPPVEGQTDDTLERYSSTVIVDKVLETNAGFVSQYDIQKGDKIIVTKK